MEGSVGVNDLRVERSSDEVRGDEEVIDEVVDGLRLLSSYLNSGDIRHTYGHKQTVDRAIRLLGGEHTSGDITQNALTNIGSQVSPATNEAIQQRMIEDATIGN